MAAKPLEKEIEMGDLRDIRRLLEDTIQARFVLWETHKEGFRELLGKVNREVYKGYSNVGIEETHVAFTKNAKYELGEGRNFTSKLIHLNLSKPGRDIIISMDSNPNNPPFFVCILRRFLGDMGKQYSEISLSAEDPSEAETALTALLNIYVKNFGVLP